MFWIKQRKTIFGGIAPGFKDGFQKGLRGEPLKWGVKLDLGIEQIDAFLFVNYLLAVWYDVGTNI